MSASTSGRTRDEARAPRTLVLHHRPLGGEQQTGEHRRVLLAEQPDRVEQRDQRDVARAELARRAGGADTSPVATTRESPTSSSACPTMFPVTSTCTGCTANSAAASHAPAAGRSASAIQ